MVQKIAGFELLCQRHWDAIRNELIHSGVPAQDAQRCIHVLSERKFGMTPTMLSQLDFVAFERGLESEADQADSGKRGCKGDRYGV